MTEVPFPQPGRCYCGALRFELTAMPYLSYLCHCSVCRRRTGAAYGVSTAVPNGSVRITEGEPVMQSRPDGSELAACGACGSKIYTRRAGRPYLTFRPGLLDDSTWITPVGQMWTANGLPWALLDGVLSYEGDPPSLQPMLDAWQALGLRAVERQPA